MTKTDQKLAICEFCEGKACFMDEEGSWRRKGCGAFPPYFEPLTDLNAIHEAIEQLRNMSTSEWFDFGHILQTICGSFMNSVQATAEQRAEALLRTIGKWKD